MLFKNLAATVALSVEQYADVDQFRESERYVRAESIPLVAGAFAIARASLALPGCTLSLVRTFPRIINGYDTTGRLIIVVPMNGTSSARINGQPIGQSLIVLKGKVNCTVYEPEGRVVAVLSICSEALDEKWRQCNAGYFLFVLPDALLACLQSSIRTALQLATDDPHIVNTAEVSSTIQQTILNALDVVLKTRDRGISAPPRSLARYKHLVDHIDFRLCQGPMTDLKCQELADEIGISVRTLQSAVNVVCGSGLHRYSRLRRLWSVRRQLRMGFPGLTVKASAWAHGFVHMSEFSDSYKKAFGELPSATLLNAQRRAVA